MTISTVHGRVMSRPARDSARLIQHVEISTATGLQVFFDPNAHDVVLFHVYDVEKPSALAVTAHLRISTNGATFESGSGYDTTGAGNASATVWGTRVSTGAGSIELIPVGVAAFATATNWGGAEMTAWIWPAATFMPPIKWEHHFANSASTPISCYGHGRAATGPIYGVDYGMGAGITFSGKADLYGFKFER